MKHRIAGCSQQELERLIEEYGTPLLRFCTLDLLDKELAEKAVREIFFQVSQSWSAMDPSVSEKAWLLHTAVSVCRELSRKRAKRRWRSCQERGLDFLQENPALQQIAAWRPAKREAFLLQYYMEVPLKESVWVQYAEGKTG